MTEGEGVEFQSGEFERNEEAIMAPSPRHASLSFSIETVGRSVLNYCRLSPPNSFGKRRQYREVKYRREEARGREEGRVATAKNASELKRHRKNPRPIPLPTPEARPHSHSPVSVSSNRGYRPCKAGKNTVSGCCYRLSFLQPALSLSPSVCAERRF